MNAVTDFPPIIEQPGTLAVPAVSIKSAVLAQFADAEKTVTALAEKYRSVAYDCATTKGMADAKAARLDLRENGRYAVQRAEARVKTEVNDLKRVMAGEVDRLVAIVRPVEDAIDGQIKAEEARKEAERAERERQAAEAARIEAERRQRLEDGIATLAGYVGKAQGKTAAQMAAGIAFVEKIQIDPAHWQEYAERAAQTLAATLEALRALHAAQVKAEADAAELEALRREKAEREAREQAEAERLAREHAELEAERIAALTAGAPRLQDAEMALADEPITTNAQESGSSPADAPAAEDAPRMCASSEPEASNGSPSGEQGLAAQEVLRAADPAEYTEGQHPQQVLKAEPATADATDRGTAADASPGGGPMGVGQPAAAGPAGEARVIIVEPDAGKEWEQALRGNGDPVPADTPLIRGEVGTVDSGMRITFAEPEPADPLEDARAFVALVLTAFEGRFPTHPKPSQEWWATVRQAGEALRDKLGVE